MTDEAEAALLENVRKKLAARRVALAERELARPPRYDAVFYEGLEWLDELERCGP
jgi:hypothetical protein